MSVTIPVVASGGAKSSVVLPDPVVTLPESPEGAVVTTVGPTINASPTPGTAGSGNLLAITTGGQISLNGVVPAAYSATANVVKLYYTNHTAYQVNAAGETYGPITATSSGTLVPPPPPPPPPPSSNFTVSNGNIFAPSSKVYLGAGINISYNELGSLSQITALFPGINIIRVACYAYSPPSYFASFVAAATAQNIVVLLENHQNFNANGTSAGNSGGGLGVVFTGTMLATESAWYAALATAFKDNPFVWFGTNNEPPGPANSPGATLAQLSTWQQATYNAIRGTGNNNIVLFCLAGAYPGLIWYQSAWGLPTQSVYTPMHNVGWDMHQYGVCFCTNSPPTPGGTQGNAGVVSQANIQAWITYMVSRVQTITSGDGVMPVIGGECGNSTTGNPIDPSGQNVVNAVIASVGSSSSLKVGCFWEWKSGAVGDKLLVNDNPASGLTSPYGTSVAAFCAAVARL